MKRLLIPGFLCMASMQAPAALIAAYQFDASSGTTTITTTDAVRGVLGEATLRNGATLVAGGIGGTGSALSLDGINDWASALNPIVNSQQQLTISTWVNVAQNTQWGSIVKDWYSTHTFHFGLDSNSGQFSNYIGGDGGQKVITTGAIATDGSTWYHVAFTFDDATNTQKIYLNGAIVGTGATNTTTTGTLATGGGEMGIGASNHPTTSQFLKGKIDDLAFYDNVLTQADITTIYNNGLAGISVVPEPSCLSLLGLGTLALLRRRRSA